MFVCDLMLSENLFFQRESRISPHVLFLSHPITLSVIQAAHYVIHIIISKNKMCFVVILVLFLSFTQS